MENIKKSNKTNTFEISAPTWNEDIEWPDGSYSVSDIQDYFEYILKKHGGKTNNPSPRIYVNIIENQIVFKIKTWHLTTETMNLLSTKSKIRKDENGENIPHLEMIEVVLILKVIISCRTHWTLAY